MGRFTLFVLFATSSVLGLTNSLSLPTNEIWIKKSKSDILVDALIKEVNHYLEVHNHTEVSIPDQSLGLATEVLGIPTNFLVNLTNGVFSNPATLFRAGPSNFSGDLFSISCSIPASFTEMAVSYKFLVDVLGIYDRGSIHLDFGRNEIDIGLEVKLIPQCQVKDLKIVVKRLDLLGVKIDGFGFVNSVAESLVETLLPLFKTSLSSTIENAVENKIRESIENKYCHMMSDLVS